jgi:hypothetical protein
MRIVIFLAANIILLLVIFGIVRSIFKQHTPMNIRLLISMMFFGGIGFAFGNYFTPGWAIFGSVFGILIGIEYKDKLFELLHLVYRDITED